MLKSFEINNENWRSSKDLKNLGSLNMLLARAAIPFIVLIKDFWLFEFIEAIINGNLFGFFNRILLLLILFHSNNARKALLEIICKIL